MEILEHHEFRVTRNEDVEVDEDESENLIQALEKQMLSRRFGPPIRLEITDDMDDVTLGLLMSELDITEQEVYRLPAPLDLGGLFQLTKIDRPALQVPAARADDQRRAAAERAERGARHLRVDRPAGRAAAPPVRVVLDERAGVPRAGRGRPARARHQADPVPHLR